MDELVKRPPKNPFRCCNLKLRRALFAFGIIFQMQRVLIFSVYFYMSMNTESFLKAYAKMAHKNSDEVLIHSEGLHVASIIFWNQEAVLIITNMFVLIGTIKQSYDFLKSWTILSIMNLSLSILVHIILMTTIDPILAFHLPISLPSYLFLVWITLNYMKELKFHAKNPELSLRSPKAREIMKPENHQVCRVGVVGGATYDQRVLEVKGQS